MNVRRFLTAREGNLAVMFGVATLPIFGAVGVAVDFSRAANVQSFVQQQADAAALAGAQLGPAGNPATIVAYVKTVTEERYGKGSWINNMTVQGEWITPLDYRIKVNGVVPTAILAAVPGFQNKVGIAASSTARIAEPRYIYTPPTLNELDNEAGDYNRISIYCFNPAKRDDPVTKGRTQMTVISDNAGTVFPYVMPRCEGGEVLSYKLLNVRLVRGEPSKWMDPRQTRFEYFTDTQIVNGKDSHDPSVKDVVETVLCKDLVECKPKSKGGIIPEGKNRIPVQTNQTCSPGKYMYYGWEDRKPGMNGPSATWTDIAWTDKDYDDIRIIIGCPTIEAVEDRLVRLVD